MVCMVKAVACGWPPLVCYSCGSQGSTQVAGTRTCLCKSEYIAVDCLAVQQHHHTLLVLFDMHYVAWHPLQVVAIDSIVAGDGERCK